MLCFKTSTEKNFFWMQTTDPKQDIRICEEVNLWIYYTRLLIKDEVSDDDTNPMEGKPIKGLDVDLSDVITPNHLESILPKILPSLIPHLPSGFDFDISDINEILRTSTFIYALKSLSQALQSPQNPHIIRSLDLPKPSVNFFTVLNFLNILQEEVIKEKKDNANKNKN
ncbi:hypothetical protein HMI54_001433 [Coelomomyces lativittatus]|nr:hypothetical protein HMI55_002276 [Coelomomyces lativittatus]KAJ1518306.1 hypothetical protein HMI54_001433 [Coelomomyces lativittatus]